MVGRELEYWFIDARYVRNPSPTRYYVGGSPVMIDSNGVQGASNPDTFTGIAKNSWDVDNSGTAGVYTAAIIRPPAVVILQKSSKEATTPWKTGAGISYAVGDLLRPSTVTVGGKTYSVWTNEDYPNVPSGAFAIYFAKIEELSGSGSDPNSMKISLGIFVKKV